MLRKHLYPTIEPYLKKAAGFLHQKGFTPDQLTVTGMVLNFVAGYVYATGNFSGGALLLLVAGLGDMLDGALARYGDQATPFGAFLDSFCDRYSDFFIFGGLALYFARENQGGYLMLTLGIIAGSYAVSYAKARAENFIDRCGVGVFDRAVRLILLFFGTLIPGILGLTLWVLFLGSNATALHRLIHTRKILLKNKPSRDV